MRRPRNSPGRVSNPLRDLLSERTRAAELTRVRQRERQVREDLPSLIDERVGEHIEKLETRLVEGFREMGQRVVEQSTEMLTSQLDGRIAQLEQISDIQTDTIHRLRDTSKANEQKVSGVVDSIEKALGDAVPGFRLTPPSHLPPQLNQPQDHHRELVRSQDRSVEDLRTPNLFCPKCTSANQREARGAQRHVGRISAPVLYRAIPLPLLPAQVLPVPEFLRRRCRFLAQVPDPQPIATSAPRRKEPVWDRLRVWAPALLCVDRLQFFVRALEVFDPIRRNTPDTRGRFFQQIVIVRDQEQRTRIFLQRDVESVDGFEIEVVGGLIEQQDIGLLQHKPAKDQASCFSARKRRGRLETLIALEKHLSEQAAQLFISRLRIELL